MWCDLQNQKTQLCLKYKSEEFHVPQFSSFFLSVFLHLLGLQRYWGADVGLCCNFYALVVVIILLK